MWHVTRAQVSSKGSLPGSQLLNGVADGLCSFFKFFLLAVGLLCLQIMNIHIGLEWPRGRGLSDKSEALVPLPV